MKGRILVVAFVLLAWPIIDSTRSDYTTAQI